MNAFKLSAVALALVASFSASAMTSIQDEDLAQVSGQDGISIGANLNINIGSFRWGNESVGHEASISFNNIDINGLMLLKIDLLNSADYIADITTDINGKLVAAGVPAATATTMTAAVVPAGNSALGYVAGSDVIKFEFPVVTGATAIARLLTPTIRVGSITTGHSGASMGSLTISRLDMQGTKVYMFGH